MYIKGHVKIVDTKDQSNAIAYCVCYVVCQHCWYEHQSMQCIECYICRHCRHWCLWLLHNTVYRVMRCENCIDSVNIDSIECIRDPCPVSTESTYIALMVWLKSPHSQLSKTFCGLKIGWILRKLWAGMCGCVLTVVLTVLTNIAFNALHALIFVSTVLTNKIPYSIHNSIALILCIDHLDMPFNVRTTDKVTMITVNSFLTI